MKPKITIIILIAAAMFVGTAFTCFMDNYCANKQATEEREAIAHHHAVSVTP